MIQKVRFVEENTYFYFCNKYPDLKYIMLMIYLWFDYNNKLFQQVNNNQIIIID